MVQNCFDSFDVVSDGDIPIGRGLGGRYLGAVEKPDHDYAAEDPLPSGYESGTRKGPGTGSSNDEPVEGPPGIAVSKEHFRSCSGAV